MDLTVKSYLYYCNLFTDKHMGGNQNGKNFSYSSLL